MNLKWSFDFGRIAGIRVSVHWTFLILLGWIFMASYQVNEDLLQALTGVGFILVLFLCVTLHEFGHALMARHFGILTRSITLLPIGGLARLERFPDSPKQEFLIAFAGPLVNLFIAFLIFLGLSLFNGIPSFEGAEDLTEFSGSGFWLGLLLANLILAFFNLIPAFPMDGGRVLRALLLYRFSRVRATRIAASLGQVLALGFVFLGFYINIFLVIIGIFIFLGAGAEAEFEMTRSLLYGFTIRDVLMKEFPVLGPEDPLQKAVDLLLDGQAQDFVVMEGETVSGILSRKGLVHGLAERGNKLAVKEVMQNEYPRYDPGMPLQDFYQQIMQNKDSVSLIFEADHFLGIVDKENVLEFIMVKEALGSVQEH